MATKKVDWGHLAQAALLLVAGGACLFYGQSEAGSALIGAGLGQLLPKATTQTVVQVIGKLPPFYRKGPGSP
jgi:hypothetical protein